MPDYKKLFTIVSVFSVVCVAVIILLSILLSANNGSKSGSSTTATTTTMMTTSQGSTTSAKAEVCVTPACISAANLILSNIDRTQDPCEDFNKFSCGSFIKNRRIPSDAGSTDTFTDLRSNLANALSDALEENFNSDDTEATKNAKRYYKSCLNEDRLETNGLNNIINVVNNELGGCSLTQANYNANNENTFDKIVKFAKWGLKPLFDVYISSNPKDPESYVVRLQQASWFLTKKTYNESDPVVIGAYKNLIKNIFNGILPSQDLDQKVDRLFELEKKLALVTLDAEERRKQTYQNFTIVNFNKNYTGFDWTRYIVQELFGAHPEVAVTENESLLVVDFGYLRGMLDIYQDALANNKDDLHNLLIWSFLKPRTGFLPKKFRDFQLDFDKEKSNSLNFLLILKSFIDKQKDELKNALDFLKI
ncbi:unnamed protein product [Brachionus calyciflorus]|uniref:Peptidase M13 N-terminal domain-containing protein n=1 Tax=Brachionus calyciflorus TaxID=104777 RepID=A0A814E4A8_9BILA|nr:unnamed protein product [Brachionus calyciflorus]